MNENLVTVTKDEFAAFRQEVFEKLTSLSQKIDYITDPQRGLYLSVHDNNSRIKKLEEENRALKADIVELKKEDGKFNAFRVQIITAVTVIQAVMALYLAFFK